MEKLARKKSLPYDLIGKSIYEIPTPALIVNVTTLKGNLISMQKLVSEHGKALRPHIKTHKSSSVAQLQMDAGAIGVTCATVGEAEAMAAVGIRDILIANQVVTPDKLERLARLLQISEIKFVVDSLYGIKIAEAVALQHNCIFEILVEVDTGGNRCGTQSPQETVALVQRIQASCSLRFGGIQAYYGGTSYIKDMEERERAVNASDCGLGKVLDAVRQISYIPRVSGAGTGNAKFHLQNGLLTEIQAGSYVYSDTIYHELASEYQHALFVLSTVISQPMETRIILDVGLKAMGTEFCDPVLVRYPHLKEYRYSEEHLQWQVNQEPSPQIGEKVLIIPSHCCTTVNLHRRCFVAQDEKVVDVWEIDAF